MFDPIYDVMKWAWHHKTDGPLLVVCPNRERARAVLQAFCERWRGLVKSRRTNSITFITGVRVDFRGVEPRIELRGWRPECACPLGLQPRVVDELVGEGFMNFDVKCPECGHENAENCVRIVGADQTRVAQCAGRTKSGLCGHKWHPAVAAEPEPEAAEDGRKAEEPDAPGGIAPEASGDGGQSDDYPVDESPDIEDRTTTEPRVGPDSALGVGAGDVTAET